MIRLMTPSTITIESVFGQIFLCQFPFTTGAVSKARPVLVLFDLAYRSNLSEAERNEVSYECAKSNADTCN